MENKKYILFDFDGTLVNSMDRLTDIAEEVLGHHFGMDLEEARAFYRETSGLAFPDQLKMRFPEAAQKREKAAKEFERKKREGYLQEKPYADTHTTIHYLREKGYKVVISSNSEQDLVDRLAALLQIPCDLALGYRGVFQKGSPHFEHILDYWNAPRETVVFIGDSIQDGQRAAANRIDFIGKKGFFSKAEFHQHFPGIPVISKLAELKEIF